MNTQYRSTRSNVLPGPLKTNADNLPLRDTNKVSSGCEECSSIYETMQYRSNFDKKFVPMYMARLPLFDTNPLNLKFEGYKLY